MDDGWGSRIPMGSKVYDERFSDIVDIFRTNLDSHLETAGAAFSVFWRGSPMVHVWGGWKDVERREEWTEETMTVLFSTTKCLSALVLAFVLQDSKRDYSDLVTAVWPEYGRNGKENTTIGDIALHRAGLPYGYRPITRNEILQPDKVSKWFEDSPPVWKPGNSSGYHALTIGLLIDQVVRRIDGRRRGVWEILDQEMLLPYGIKDLSIGLRKADDNANVATLRGVSDCDLQIESERNPESLRRYNLGGNAYNDRLNEIFSWIQPTCDDYNKLDNRVLHMPSNMGIGNAHSFARLLSLVANGRILNHATLRKISSPVLVEAMDIINGYEESKGYGFQYTRSPRGNWVFGHSGLGGQNVRIDVSNQLSIAYVCNGMKVADADLVIPWRRLVEAVYRKIDKIG